MFDFESDRSWFWVKRSLVWNVFKSEYTMSDKEIETLISRLATDYFKRELKAMTRWVEDEQILETTLKEKHS
jgi:hypothetical protein